MSQDKELELIRRKKMIEMMTTKQLPDSVVNISSVDHFNEIVNDYIDNIIIVDFWAAWCGPCKAFAPAFEALQKEFKSKGVIFAKLNVDDLGQIAQQFQVSGIPTTLFIKNKKLVHRQVGMAPKAQFASIIDTVIKKNTK
ncbi:Thiol-disulfide oxidoreductase ResA [Candidatus Lokiarchaeum ossiferum]|uniref:Thiol-disulfide oxidoreductase ResA n=1 Tax=Candidatus Lokiarchaeum ossiferum TaxID=2951803 RepID=A0ABY6HXS2_9ARCH|nr:Thiol-disulfide oxidoreductase ResA [Candidatus Lokiarchaeum sp. B-35]